MKASFATSLTESVPPGSAGWAQADRVVKKNKNEKDTSAIDLDMYFNTLPLKT